MLTIYKKFVRSHLDYADIIYDKEKLEKVQYPAALIITGAIEGISRERFYQELGLESLCDRRSYRKLVFAYNIVFYLYYLLSNNDRTYNTGSSS